MDRSAWLRRLGAAAGIAVLLIPMVLVCALTARAAPDFWLGLPVIVVLTTGAHRTEGPLVFHAGSHISWDLGLLLATLPAAVTMWLLAPFAEYRRRDALMTLLPVWNLLIIAKIGARAVDAASVDFAVDFASSVGLPSQDPKGGAARSRR